MGIQRRFAALSQVALTSDRIGARHDNAGFTSGSFQIIWLNLTGSVDAVAKIQVSNTGEDGEWVDKDSATHTLADASGQKIINVTNLVENYCRLVVTKNSVTGGQIRAVAYFTSFGGSA
jgi:hypothetical protein